MAKKKKKTDIQDGDELGGGKQQPADNKSKLDLAKKAIAKKYGSGVIMSMGEEKELFIPTISSGSLGLDMALGRGGFARGRIYEFYGPPSGGKTTLAMSLMAQAQKRGFSTCFVDAEHTADPQLFKAMGVNIDDVIKIKAYAGEDNIDALETLIKTGTIDVAVVDSVSALIPKMESEAAVEDDFIGLLARLMSKTMRRIVPIASETNTLVVFINQLRFKIGSWGDPTTTTGGEALNFYATGRISVAGGEFKKTRIPHPITGEIIGHDTTFSIQKNKLAPPWRSATVRLIYGVGYDIYREALSMAEGLAVVEKNGAHYYFEGERFAQGEENAVEYVKNNEEFYNKIRNSVIDITGLREHYERNS